MIESDLDSLDIYKKFEKSELALHKLQLENAKKNNEIIKLKEELHQYKTNVSNSSTSFPWPEEFKNKWESLIKTMIMDTFENISFKSVLLMRTINIILKIIYEISKNKIKEKIIELLQCLNIKSKSDEVIKKFFNKYQKILFQNYFNSLFIINDESISKIISQIKDEFYSNKYNQIFSQEDINNIKLDISSKNMLPFIKELFYLCLFMNINIPQLTIKTNLDINYKYFNKNNYINIEGFANDGDICLIIINPPMIKPNMPFMGIKPVVCIIENPSKEIISLCEQQKIMKIRREQSKSFCSFSNNKLLLHKANSNNQNNNENKKMNGYNINTKDNKIIKKNSAQLINGCNTNNSSTTDGTTNRDRVGIGHNLSSNIFEMKLNNDISNIRKLSNNNNRIIVNKYSSLKMVDIQINEQQNKRNNFLYQNNNEYKSKSSDREIQNKINNQNKDNEYHNNCNIKNNLNNLYCNQKQIQKINNIKNKNLNKESNIIKNYYYNDYNMRNNNLYKEPNKKMNSFSNNIDNKKINNCANKIENYINSNISSIDKDSINNTYKLKITQNINKDKKNIYNNRNYKLDINYHINNHTNINPLMNSLKDYSTYLQLQENQNSIVNYNLEKSRNNNIIKDEFKYNILNHNNIKNKKERYTVYNKSSNNINNKIIITTSDYSKQNTQNINNNNIVKNENHLISIKKTNNINSNKSLNNGYINNEDYRSITPVQITEISNNKISNGKYNISIHQLTDNSVNNNNNIINDKNITKTTIKKISSNNYHLRKIIENNNYINNKNISNNSSCNNKPNIGNNSGIKSLSPYEKNYDFKLCQNLKYNLSFKKNYERNSQLNNNNLLYENNNYNIYSDHSHKTKNRTNSNDINIKRRAYITNINKERIQNHSNIDIKLLNKDFSSSSILSSNSQVKNNNYNDKNIYIINKRRDYSSNSNINNNTYNDITQLKTEISERTKSSYFINKNDINLINNNLIRNIKFSKKNFDLNNSSNRNNIHYTKNNNYTKNLVSKKLNFQINYESNQHKPKNIIGKKK